MPNLTKLERVAEIADGEAAAVMRASTKEAHLYQNLGVQLGEDVLKAIQSEKALNCLSKFIAKGVHKEDLLRILKNQHILGAPTPPMYTMDGLFSHLGDLADVEGVGDLLKALKANNPQVKGVCEELFVAQHLMNTPGVAVKIIGKPFNRGLKGGTDFDIIIEIEGQLKYVQSKRSAGSFRSLKKTEAWVNKALDDMERVGADRDYGNIFYATPAGEAAPANIKEWFDKKLIEVKPFPPGLQ